MACTVIPPIPKIPPKKPPPDNGGEAAAKDMVANMQAKAAQHLSNASSLLGEIMSAANNVSGDLSVNSYTGSISAPFDPGSAPETCSGDANYPDDPPFPSLAALTFPSFSDLAPFVPTPLDLNLDIELPPPLAASAPDAVVPDAVAQPDAPTIVLPPVPTMLELALPPAPSIDLPTFQGELSDAPAPLAVTFGYSEEEYSSAMLSRLRSGFQSLLDRQSTGIADATETALWGRARGRDAALSASLATGIRRSIVSRGGAVNPSAQAVTLSTAAQSGQHRFGALERSIVIKRAELQQSNRKFAFQLTQQFESMLIAAYSELEQRAFDAARFAQEAAIRAYNQMISVFSAEVQAFSARADVFKANLEREIAKIEVYKALLQGQALVGEINQQQVETYKAMIAGITTAADIYRAQVDGARAAVDANKSRIEGFGEQIKGYSEEVKAKSAEYTAYGIAVTAESSKIDVYVAQADAFKAETDGYKSAVSALVGQKQLEYAVAQEMPIETYMTQAEAYREIVDAATSEIRASVSLLEANASMAAANMRGVAAGAQVSGNAATANSQVTTAGARLQAEAAGATGDLTAEGINVATDAARQAGQIAAQIGAATYMWAHGSVAISYRDSLSAHNSRSDSGLYAESGSHTNSCVETIYHKS